jgi:hypothetical protein
MKSLKRSSNVGASTAPHLHKQKSRPLITRMVHEYEQNLEIITCIKEYKFSCFS